MGIPAISSLANMEYMLYGNNAGMNMNCPSYFNGYRGNSMSSMMNYAGVFGGYYNPSFRGAYPGQDVFTLQNDATRVSNPAQQVAQSNPQADMSNPQFRGLSDDLNELGDYYIKNSAPSESFIGAAVGGAAFGLMQNPRMIVHPWNSLTSTGAVEKMFAGVKDETTAIGKLWRNSEVGGYEIVSNAYSRMHKLESLQKGKLGLFRRSLSKLSPEAKAEADLIKKGMTEALAAGDAKQIAYWTERAKRLTNAFTGFIPKGLRAIGLQKPLTWVRSKINPTHYDKNIVGVADKAVTDAGAKTTFGQFMKRSCGIGNGLLFAGMEFALDFGKIQTAFSKDSSTGWKQVGQTAIKGAGSAIGWAVGEGIGAWAGAKLGAAAGTAICPGLGTAIGAVAGLIGGSVGCWLMGKITHKITGPDAGTKVEVENMKRTAQGQVQLLQLTASQAQDDKKLNPRTLQAINNIANFYGAA